MTTKINSCVESIFESENWLKSFHSNRNHLNMKKTRIFTSSIKNSNIFRFFLLFSFSVRQSNEPGWLDGTLNGKSGLIPENYVEVLK